MACFTIKNKQEKGILPPFSIAIQDSEISAIYSDSDVQAALLNYLQNQQDMIVFDETDGLYERLTVENNVRFFHKWFNCTTPLAEIMVMCKLTSCADTPLRKCSTSEIRRVRYAKYFMMNTARTIFLEPIHGVRSEER